MHELLQGRQQSYFYTCCHACWTAPALFVLTFRFSLYNVPFCTCFSLVVFHWIYNRSGWYELPWVLPVTVCLLVNVRVGLGMKVLTFTTASCWLAQHFLHLLLWKMLHFISFTFDHVDGKITKLRAALLDFLSFPLTSQLSITICSWVSDFHSSTVSIYFFKCLIPLWALWFWRLDLRYFQIYVWSFIGGILWQPICIKTECHVYSQLFWHIFTI